MAASIAPMTLSTLAAGASLVAPAMLALLPLARRYGDTPAWYSRLGIDVVEGT